MINKKRTLYILILLSVLSGSIVYTVLASALDSKYDGDCSPLATLGRCADKPAMPVISTPEPTPAVDQTSMSQNIVTVENPVDTGDNFAGK